MAMSATEVITSYIGREAGTFSFTFGAQGAFKD